ncbi:MAG: N-acetylmuramoyl-L-alanine amidase [Robiginitomaculum sp.]|nr:MAG: N-acetylmuramoyl-L-alanine amidase [Robiginitomaculum sp.]
MKLTTKIGVFLVLGWCLFAIKAFAGDVTGIKVSVVGVKTKIEIRTSGKISAKVFALKVGAPRIVIDLGNAKFSPALQRLDHSVFPGAGGVAQVRAAARGKTGLRLVADMAMPVQSMSYEFENGVFNVWITGEGQVSAQTSILSPISSRIMRGIAYPRLKPQLWVENVVGVPSPHLKNARSRIRMRKPVIVIDPGHGGNDPGAIGITKVREEIVTLKAAQELRRQLLKTGRYRVVLTRNSDVYVKHEKRVRIAREAGADLFISLHADSLEKTIIRGASVYTLADRAHKRGQNLVNTQNWILDVDLASHSEAVGDILVNLAQRKTLSKSAQFADILIPQLKKRTVLLGNTHRRAGLYVLLAPDVPAILLEMGFLSNKEDEKLLNTSKHRAKLMKSVTEAINLYFKKQTTLQRGL